MNYAKLVEKAQKNLFIIGEAGVNHNGSLSKAKELVDVAKEAGCDAVKFQTWVTDKVYSRKLSIKPDYQQRSTPSSESEYETVKKLELSFETFREIKDYCEKKGILFFSTPDESDSADFLRTLDVKLMKTASQDVTNLPFLRYLARMKIPMIFSTGGSTLDEVVTGVQTILAENKELMLLHCVSSYPTPLEQLNLRVIPVLASMFGCPVGFSDHTLGVEAACAAVALGAEIFEKHFTLDRNMEGPDHQASLDPAMIKHYVATLRSIHAGLGDGHKRIVPCEADTSRAFRRYLVAARPIRKGEVLRADDFLFKKTVTGLAPKFLDHIVGASAKIDIAEDAPIELRQIAFE